jgi:hypothetical protein
LIIFKVVVLPQPEGPTNMTIFPAGTSMVSPSTAGFAWPAYRLVTWSSRMRAPVIPSARAGTAVVSDTDTSRSCESTQAEEQEIKDESKNDDTNDAGDNGFKGIRAAEPGEAGKNEAAQSWAQGISGHSRNPHDHLGGDTDPGQDHWPRHGQLNLDKGAGPAHPDSAGGFND